MRRFASAILLGGLCLVASAADSAQAPLPQSVPSVAKSWPTYNGDVSGRRYSRLSQINTANVASLRLAWSFQTHAATLKSTPVEVDGILYFTVPDRVWAVDARTGAQIWTFFRSSQGDHLGQRGVGYYKGRLYFGTPDAHILCLDAKNGKLLWNVTVADVKFGYYISTAPLVLDGKIIFGTSGDEADIPHSIYALDWETGKLIWKRSILPEPGDPAEKTWPNRRAMEHGGGAAWLTGTYDPELHLLYWGTGNPHPVIDGNGRKGDNLYTCSILALDPDTGKIQWWYQVSPHDVHDWDAVETPVIFDAVFQGRPRKLLAQASRNGYFFLLDRRTGQHLLTAPFVPMNWASGIDRQGRPIADPAKAPSPAGSLIRGAAGGGTNWMPPSFDPQTGLFYVNAQEGYSLWHLALDSEGHAADHQGGGSSALISEPMLEAIDYRTGEIRWKRKNGAGFGTPGILTTAGGLLFTGDVSGNLFALDAPSGRVLWRTRPGANLSNGPMTYELGGRQYVLAGADGVLDAWTLPVSVP